MEPLTRDHSSSKTTFFETFPFIQISMWMNPSPMNTLLFPDFYYFKVFLKWGATVIIWTQCSAWTYKQFGFKEKIVLMSQGLFCWHVWLNLQTTLEHIPMLLVPCGHTLCKHCSSSHSNCRLCGTRVASLTTNIMLQQIIQEFHRKGQRGVSVAHRPLSEPTWERQGGLPVIPPKTTTKYRDGMSSFHAPVSNAILPIESAVSWFPQKFLLVI